VEAFAKALPPGVINFISGSGRETMPPLMASGSIDGLAFIGGSNAADDLIRKHPEPHRLKLFLQLEAKNMGVSMAYMKVVYRYRNKDEERFLFVYLFAEILKCSAFDIVPL
jgi:acyl-CoA reductase-like NAD-dependent aldehyde dehydrogenase